MVLGESPVRGHDSRSLGMRRVGAEEVQQGIGRCEGKAR